MSKPFQFVCECCQIERYYEKQTTRDNVASRHKKQKKHLENLALFREKERNRFVGIMQNPEKLLENMRDIYSQIDRLKRQDENRERQLSRQSTQIEEMKKQIDLLSFKVNKQQHIIAQLCRGSSKIQQRTITETIQQMDKSPEKMDKSPEKMNKSPEPPLATKPETPLATKPETPLATNCLMPIREIEISPIPREPPANLSEPKEETKQEELPLNHPSLFTSSITYNKPPPTKEEAMRARQMIKELNKKIDDITENITNNTEEAEEIKFYKNEVQELEELDNKEEREGYFEQLKDLKDQIEYLQNAIDKKIEDETHFLYMGIANHQHTIDAYESHEQKSLCVFSE